MRSIKLQCSCTNPLDERNIHWPSSLQHWPRGESFCELYCPNAAVFLPCGGTWRREHALFCVEILATYINFIHHLFIHSFNTHCWNVSFKYCSYPWWRSQRWGFVDTERWRTSPSGHRSFQVRELWCALSPWSRSRTFCETRESSEPGRLCWLEVVSLLSLVWRHYFHREFQEWTIFQSLDI